MADSTEQVFCVFVPLAGETWLLPNAAIADVLAYSDIEAHTGSPDWLLGHLAWKGLTLPVISVEPMYGLTVPERTARARLLVVQSMGDSDGTGQFIVVAQGYPQLVTLNSKAIEHDAERELTDEMPVLSAVKIANRHAIIPDCTAIEGRVSALVAVAGVTE